MDNQFEEKCYCTLKIIKRRSRHPPGIFAARIDHRVRMGSRGTCTEELVLPRGRARKSELRDLSAATLKANYV